MTPRAARRRIASRTVAIASGKGGVGKSTVSLNLALALAEASARTGLLDADFYGPDIPLMVGLVQRRELKTWALATNQALFAKLVLSPVERFGLKIMSNGFILTEEQPWLMDGMTTELLMHQLVNDVDWGDLDWLIVDLPPGTADVQQALLRRIQLDGALLVVTPQDVAHLDAKKVVSMCRRAKVRILGGIENMSGFVCPHCGELTPVFSTVPAERSVWSLGIERLGAVPFDPSISAAGDSGMPALVAHPESAYAAAFRALAATLTSSLSEPAP
jgi:ATP-binding protein involved in chromosome partitioning